MDAVNQQQKSEIPLTCHNDVNKHLLEIFPEELWAFVIDRIEGQVNLQNFMAAFPEASSIFAGQLTNFMFTQVSRGIFEFSTKQKFSTMNKIFDKDWHVCVGSFLERYNSELERQEEFQYYVPNAHPSLRETETFSKRQEVQSFYEDLTQDSSQAKELLDSKVIKMKDVKTMRHLKVCNALFTDFGIFIKTLDIRLDMTRYEKRNGPAFWKEIITCVEKVPNVQELCWEIYGAGISSSLTNVLNQCACHPVLQKLRELKITGCLNNLLLQYFLRGNYFRNGTIDKLILRMDDYWHEDRLSSYYGYVVEYNLKGVKCAAETVEQFEGFLRGQKQKTNYVEGWDKLDLSVLFRWISEEPHLGEELIIKSLLLTRIKCRAMVPIPLLPSIQYLEISDNGINDFRFLKSLPSLQYLKIIGHAETKIKFLWGRDEKFFTRLVRSYLYKDKISSSYNIWEELPSLRLLIVQDGNTILKYFVKSNGNSSVQFKFGVPLGPREYIDE